MAYHRIGASGPVRGLGTRLSPGAGEALLATWHNLLDAGRMQDGEPNLAGTAMVDRPPERSRDGSAG